MACGERGCLMERMISGRGVDSRKGPLWVCAVVRRRSSVGASPTRQLSLRPEAIGAVMEVTKWLKFADLALADPMTLSSYVEECGNLS